MRTSRTNSNTTTSKIHLDSNHSTTSQSTSLSTLQTHHQPRTYNTIQHIQLLPCLIVIYPPSSHRKERVRVIFRKDNSMSFLENVHVWFRSIEESNRSKAEVLLVKKLFIDSFQSVSHEFGTALNCINNLSELACSVMPKSTSETILKPIKYNSTLIQFLINDILDHHMIL